jgi:hypothetical protein
VALVASPVDLGIAALNQRDGGSIHGEKLWRSWNGSSKRSIQFGNFSTDCYRIRFSFAWSNVYNSA